MSGFLLPSLVPPPPVGSDAFSHRRHLHVYTATAHHHTHTYTLKAFQPSSTAMAVAGLALLSIPSALLKTFKLHL